MRLVFMRMQLQDDDVGNEGRTKTQRGATLWQRWSRIYKLNEKLRIIMKKKKKHTLFGPGSNEIACQSEYYVANDRCRIFFSLQMVELCKYCSAKLLSRCAHYSWLKLRAINSEIQFHSWRLADTSLGHSPIKLISLLLFSLLFPI